MKHIDSGLKVFGKTLGPGAGAWWGGGREVGGHRTPPRYVMRKPLSQKETDLGTGILSIQGCHHHSSILDPDSYILFVCFSPWSFPKSNGKEVLLRENGIKTALSKPICHAV